MRLLRQFFRGREIRIETGGSPGMANERINSGLDSPRRGIFLSALTGYAVGDAVDLEYYSIFWPIPVVSLRGGWEPGHESATLRVRLGTSWFLKAAFAVTALLPLLFLLHLPTDGVEFRLRSLANGFGYLVLACFMILAVLLMGAVFQQNAETRLRRLLACPTRRGQADGQSGS